jgi:hypothetical protein
MKKLVLLALMAMLALCNAYASDFEPKDTTVYFRDKVIQINDSIDQVSIKVSTRTENGEEPYQTVFEGLYSDRKSYERWSVVENLGIQIPFITKKSPAYKSRKMEAHWAGYGLGFTALTDGISYNGVDGMDLILGKSAECNINIAEHILPMFFNTVGITTGIGFSSRNYYLDNSKILVSTNDVVSVFDNSPVKYKYSRLKNWYLTVPLLLEFQPFNSNKDKPYIAIGVVGGVRLSTTFRSRYYTTSGSTIKTKEQGMNVLPITYEYMAQAGTRNMSIYFKYSPISIFEAGKGPNVQHTSIGFMFDFN